MERRRYNKHMARKMLLAVAAMVVVGGIVTSMYLATRYLSRDNRDAVDYVSKTNRPDGNSPDYPVPAGIERKLAEYYTGGDIQYVIDWTLRTDADPPILGDHEFLVTLQNTLNKSVSISAEGAKSFTVGCVAYGDPYSTATVEAADVSFEPYERKKITVSVKPSCVYLGTADGSSYWPIY